jgi:hypothetical protein
MARRALRRATPHHPPAAARPPHLSPSVLPVKISISETGPHNQRVWPPFAGPAPARFALLALAFGVRRK